MTVVRSGYLPEVRRLVQAGRRLFNTSWPFLSNRFPLSSALSPGHEEIALYLMENGVSPAKGSFNGGAHPSLCGAGAGLVRAAEGLIKRHSFVNARNVARRPDCIGLQVADISRSRCCWSVAGRI